MLDSFVNLYHVWGVFGLVTAVLYGRLSYRSWREAGGTWRRAPGEWLYALRWNSREMGMDVLYVFRWALAAMVGGPLGWRPERTYVGPGYQPRQIIALGVTLGGTARFLTAIYWSERNHDWMQHADASVLAQAAIPVMFAVCADVLNHYTAWPEARHRSRLLVFAALLWIAAPLMLR